MTREPLQVLFRARQYIEVPEPNQVACPLISASLHVRHATRIATRPCIVVPHDRTCGFLDRDLWHYLNVTYYDHYRYLGIRQRSYFQCRFLWRSASPCIIEN